MDFTTVGSLTNFPGLTAYTGVSGLSLNNKVTGIADVSDSLGTGTVLLETSKLGAYTNVKVYNSLWAGSTLNYSFTRANYLYGSNGYDFFFYDPYFDPSVQSTFQYGLPKPYFLGYTSSSFGSTGGLSGALTVYFAFGRFDNLNGPVSYFSAMLAGVSAIAFNAPTLQIAAGSGVSYGSFGISLMNVWYTLNGSTPKRLSTSFTVGPTFTITDQFTNYATHADQPEDYFGTYLYGAGNGASFATTSPSTIQYNPSCIETFNNQLFAGGFNPAFLINPLAGSVTKDSFDPDTVSYSQIGNYEKHDNDGFFSVRKGDGDIVSCIKAYFTDLLIFKVNSAHILSGDNPDNFVLREATSQYGCLSANGACIFEQKLWFLDKKGIAEFNGANTQIISQKVEKIFLRMNITAARNCGYMIHVKERNEVWCAIPIDGATTNNVIIIYDYVAQAWTTKSTSNLNAIYPTIDRTSKQKVYFGFTAGNFTFLDTAVGETMTGGDTMVIQSRFIGDLGHSVEKMFRRLYLDASITPGVTYNIALNFYTNQGASAAYSTTMTLNGFQNRIDFGLSSRDLSVEMIYSGGQYLKINGYTIEYRFQRAV